MACPVIVNAVFEHLHFACFLCDCLVLQQENVGIGIVYRGRYRKYGFPFVWLTFQYCKCCADKPVTLCRIQECGINKAVGNRLDANIWGGVNANYPYSFPAAA